MSDMQWRRADGSEGTYTGPLVSLGQGIPRKMRGHGFRRALYDLAFGYVSGFPVRDVLAFSFRSLFSHAIIPELEMAESDDGDSVHVGTVYIACPQCGEAMPATVSAVVEDEAGDGMDARLVCTPDMTDIHAHVWAHSHESAG